MKDNETIIYVYPQKGYEIPETIPVMFQKVATTENIKKIRQIVETKANTMVWSTIKFEGCSNTAIRQVLLSLKQLNKSVEIWSNQLGPLDYAIGMRELSIWIDSPEQYYNIISKIPANIKISASPDVMEVIYEDVIKNKRIKEINLVAYTMQSIDETIIERYKPKSIKLVDTHGNLNVKNVYTPSKFLSIKYKILQYVSSIDPNLPEIEKFLKVYKALGENVNYDYRETREEAFFVENHSLEGLMVDLLVCEGMAMALSEMLALLGVNSKTIRGENDGDGHEWNKVLIGKKWYNCDITSDRVYIKQGQSPKMCLKSDDTFKDEDYTFETEDEDFKALEDYDDSVIEEYFSHDHNRIAELIKSENSKPSEIIEIIQKLRQAYPYPLHIIMFESDGKHYGLKFRRELRTKSLIDISPETPTFEKEKRGEFLKEYQENIGIGMAKRGILLSDGIILRYDGEYERRQNERKIKEIERKQKLLEAIKKAQENKQEEVQEKAQDNEQGKEQEKIQDKVENAANAQEIKSKERVDKTSKEEKDREDR